MKFKNSLFLIAKCAIILSACSKKTSDSPVDVPDKYAPTPAFTTSITKEQAAVLDSLMAHGKITSPADFRKKLDSLKSLASKNGENSGVLNRVADDDPASYNESSENLYNGVTSDNVPGFVVSADSYKKTVQANFQVVLDFIIRGNQILVQVPYQYDWLKTSSTGVNAIQNVQQTTQVQLLPTGAYWGEVTQGAGWYVNGQYPSDVWQRGTGITAFGTAQEKRTKIVSTTGKVKISASADLGGFEIGSELEVGFTVQNAYNIYNQYTMNAYGQIWIDPYANDFQPPRAQFIGNIGAKQYGILKNE